MPLPDEQLEEIKTEDIKPKPGISAVNTKVLIFGIPIFIFQLIVVYFVTANILMKRLESRASTPPNNTTNTTAVPVNQPVNTQPVEYGKYIYSIDDLIVNPADTDGKRLLLTSVGIDLGKLEMENDLKSREPMVKDVIISTLASKSIDQLDNTAYRDTLKIEISSKLKKLIPSVSINNIYFSKYIIQ
ncbi:MAG: flagellar basal body-associated FliL family protein [Bacteroidetes bacterium]|nr:flagellar basal body-associated FliL family protein [Bacteroidota bacterium]